MTTRGERDRIEADLRTWLAEARAAKARMEDAMLCALADTLVAERERDQARAELAALRAAAVEVVEAYRAYDRMTTAGDAQALHGSVDALAALLGGRDG